MSTDVQRGREAFTGRDWDRAFELLSAADASGTLEAEDLELLGEAAFATGRHHAYFDADERAYAGYRERDDARGAARLAITVAGDYLVRGEFAVAVGWSATAGRLLEGHPNCPELGLHYVLRAWMALLMFQRSEEAIEYADRATEIGLSVNDRNVEVGGRVIKGWALARLGRVAEGMPLLDEAMAAVVGGQLSPRSAEAVYCNTINTCSYLGDYRRAGEWTDAAKRAFEERRVVPPTADCRIHRAQILRMRGEWDEAEAEALCGCDEFEHDSGDRNHVANGMYEIGELKLRRGDLEGAEHAFERTNELGWPPQPGLALVRLARGEVDAAAALLSQALSNTVWFGDDLRRATLLPAQVEIRLAARDLAAARDAATELEAIAARFGTPGLRARSLYARGAVHLAEGDAGAGLPVLQETLRLWVDLACPYEGARTRMLLASAYRSLGDDESARLELRAARSAFERLGARPDVQEVDQLLSAEAAPTRVRVGRTFMFTDIVRHTDLMDAIGDEAWEDVIRWHDTTLRSLFSRHGGEEVSKAGDGFFIAFADAGEAIACSIGIQRALADHRRNHGFAPQVRIGLHTDEATRAGTDYRGKGVNIASRIGDLADGGQIVASARSVPTDVAVSDPRAVKLKGISAPVDLVTIVWR